MNLGQGLLYDKPTSDVVISDISVIIDCRENRRPVMKSSLNNRLKEARIYLDLSQEYVATQMGLHRTAITAIESGQRRVSTEELKKFSQLYGISLDEIAYGEDQNSDVKVLARRYSELSDDDKREIMNLVDFKLRLKKMRTNIA